MQLRGGSDEGGGPTGDGGAAGSGTGGTAAGGSGGSAGQGGSAGKSGGAGASGTGGSAGAGGSASGGAAGAGGTAGSAGGKPNPYDKACSSADMTCNPGLTCDAFSLGAPGVNGYRCTKTCSKVQDCGDPPDGGALACIPSSNGNSYCTLLCDYMGKTYSCPKGSGCGGPGGIGYKLCFAM